MLNEMHINRRILGQYLAICVSVREMSSQNFDLIVVQFI